MLTNCVCRRSIPLLWVGVLIAATLLFGSLARSDHSEGSDTDLLLISLDQETRHVSIGHLSLFVYPWSRLQQDAKQGELFICHLVYEAKPLVDPDDYLTKLRAAFLFRPTYSDDIQRGVEFGWYLVRFGGDINPSLLKKRALWCIRTILIARSVEQRQPIFAPQHLAKRTRSTAARNLISNRHDQASDLEVRQALRQFLDNEGGVDNFLKFADRQTFMERFTLTSNKVALHTLQQQENISQGYT